MDLSITEKQHYLLHTLNTRYHTVKTYRSGYSIAFGTCRYKISKASLMQGNKRLDGTRESLRDRSHRPHTPRPQSHTDTENQ